jgi:chorismate lyase/3-hydroxybenzoate synthase
MPDQCLPPTAGAVPCSVVYLDAAATAAVLADDRTLAVIGFGGEDAPTADPRCCRLALPELGENRTIEVWRGRPPVQAGRAGALAFVVSQDVLFMYQHLAEAEYPDLAEATTVAYRQLFAFSRQQGYPHLLRVWNYFPGINQAVVGLERYQAFCRGRYQVLTEAMPAFESHLPAASALGSQAGGLVIYALASRQAGLQVENPRQISAFHYPRQYGPRSPSFSRSILQSWQPTLHHLYISGTASIVGHATCHRHDEGGQLQETIANLEALLANASRLVATPFRLILLKVYLRQPAALATVQTWLSERFGTALPTVYLQADICRSDLLLEIEGVAISSGAAGNPGRLLPAAG